MRPVDLLPKQYQKRRRTSKGRPGSAYAIVGVLGAVFVAVFLYALSANQVSSRQTETQEAKREANEAQARVAALGPFGSFAEIAKTRKASVAALAQQRFDWERLMREVARVLPEGTWLTEANASATGTTAGAATGAGSGGGAAPTAAGAGGPNVQLVGCTRKQPDVAKLIVRLKRLHRAQDVSLAEAARAKSGSGGSGGSSAGAGAGDCGTLIKFDLTVTFEALPAPDTSGKPVPATLGGGS